MEKHALVILAPGFEEIEAITPIDVLRRAGVAVTVAGTIEGEIVASRQTRHRADTSLDAVVDNTYDMIVLPGGADGTQNLAADARVKKMIARHHQQGRWIAAICAAPTILASLDWLGASRLICHPGVQAQVPPGKLCHERVVVDGRLITSLAAGSSMEFSAALVRALCGDDSWQRVNQGLCALLP
jgi:DJ-1 family protein